MACARGAGSAFGRFSLAIRGEVGISVAGGGTRSLAWLSLCPMRWKAAAPGAATLVIAGWFGAAGMAAAEPPPPPPPVPVPAITDDGTYAVGTDIQAGTYTSAGPSGDTACYWKRVNGSDIVDNALTKKAQTVRIEPGDTAFVTSHCQPWLPADCAAGCPPAGPPPQDLLGSLRDLILTPPAAPPAPG
jgi:hypothetical protein